MSEPFDRAVEAAISTIIDAGGTIDFRVQPVVHAAIDAIRIPSEEMHRAAKEKREADKKKGVPTPWGSVYEAMIDELLR